MNVRLISCATHSWTLIAAIVGDPELVTKSWTVRETRPEEGLDCGYCGKAADYVMEVSR